MRPLRDVAVERVKQGDTAEIRCAFANGQNTLTRIEKRR